MVRSHALYPIELRAHCAEIASLNYNGNRIVSPNPIDGRARRKTLSRGLLRLRFAPNAALAVEIGGPAENGRFASQSKSFRPSAKPTAPAFLPMHVGNALAMAADMLLLGADEVARNGAFGKQLRPEVFPNAPLQNSVCR